MTPEHVVTNARSYWQGPGRFLIALAAAVAVPILWAGIGRLNQVYAAAAAVCLLAILAQRYTYKVSVEEDQLVITYFSWGAMLRLRRELITLEARLTRRPTLVELLITEAGEELYRFDSRNGFDEIALLTIKRWVDDPLTTISGPAGHSDIP